MSLAQKILDSKKPFVLFHTWSATKDIVIKAIKEGKSMDLDVCLNDFGNPYLGHSKEYHEKSGETIFNSMPLWEAVDMISNANIAVIVDCKHFDAWPIVEEIVAKIAPEKCLVHIFASELKFDYNRKEGEPDFTTEWLPIKRLVDLKIKFPAATATVSAKWLPEDLLISEKNKKLLDNVRQVLIENHVDTVCLNVPCETMSDKWLRYFLEKNIIPHVEIDKIGRTKLSEIYIGETNDLRSASNSSFLI